MQSVVKTQNLTRKFNSLTAVDNLNLEIQEGEIFGLVGPDGAGKSTTLRLLSGILEPTSGEAWVCGKHIIKQCESLKSDTAYMPQRFGLYDDLTVMENINFYADIYEVGLKERAERTVRLLEFSGLKIFKNRLAGNLSGGMKQKLGLTCALIHTPKVLLLDEPTNGVDPVSRRDFWKILNHLLEEHVTILLSTSYLDEAERCKRIGFMHKGRLLEINSPSAIKKEHKAKSLEDAFISITKEQASG
jgi:ABC-2 type transport system ATP-binding protein